MATTKLNNGQLPTTLSSKTIDNTNDISTTTTKLKISGGTNGQVLSTDGSGNLSWATAGSGGLGAPTYEVVKTADETVTNSSTLQDDDHLFYTLPANKTYFVQLHIIAQKAAGTASIGPTFALDASSTGYWQHMLTSSPVIANSTNTLSAFQAATIGGYRTYQLFYAALNVGSSITLKVRWAQGSANASGATVYKGSKLQIWEIA